MWPSDLVVRDKNGEPQTVRYEQINAMLLNEFLKEQESAGIGSYRRPATETDGGFDGPTQRAG